MTGRLWHVGVLGCTIAVWCPLDAAGQVRASERGLVAQTVDGTTITVDYARPQARGRTPFGEVVHWGEVWTPGANWATTFTASKDVRINGTDLPRGTYSLWLIPRQGDWTVLLHPTARLFHVQRPNPNEAAATLTVTPGQRPHREVLTFEFEEVKRDRTILAFSWGSVALSLTIEVPSSIAGATISAAAVAEYLGTFTTIMVGEDGKDSPPMNVVIVLEGGKLYAKTGEFAMRLLPAGRPHTFLVAFEEKGEIIDVAQDYPLVFTRRDGKVSGYLVANDGGDVWMRADRAP